MKINQVHFNISLILVCALFVGFAVLSGVAANEGVVGNLGGMALKLSVFFASAFGFQYFFLGTSRNIPEEIFEAGNLAAAQYMGAVLISIALVIAGGWL